MKGTFRIGGAIVFGVGLILMAFYMRDRVGTSEEGRIVVAPAPERTAIKSLDADKNGVPDWQEELEAQVFQAIETPTSFASGESYEPPTTFTGRFSEAFLQDYLNGKIQGVDYSDSSEFVENALRAVEAGVRNKRYTPLDIERGDSDTASVHAYGSALALVIAENSIENENEVAILERALKERNEAMLEPLELIENAYAAMVRDALLLTVPETLADEHIALVNALEAIRADVKAMQSAFTDPLYALARLRTYEEDVRTLVGAFSGISSAIFDSGVSYQKEELASFLYIFRP